MQTTCDVASFSDRVSRWAAQFTASVAARERAQDSLPGYMPTLLCPFGFDADEHAMHCARVLMEKALMHRLAEAVRAIEAASKNPHYARPVALIRFAEKSIHAITLRNNTASNSLVSRLIEEANREFGRWEIDTCHTWHPESPVPVESLRAD